MKYTKELAEKLLELMPDWMAIAVNLAGSCYYYKDIPRITDYGMWSTGLCYGLLGKFTYDGDWKDTLVVRKCSHYVSPRVDCDWKYCPKCGELLGSK